MFFRADGKKYEIKSDLSSNNEVASLQKEEIKTFVEKCWDKIIYGSKEEVEKLIDINSAIDTYLVEEFVKNLDMGYDSFYLHRKSGKLYFGPIWDFDLSLGNGDETCQYPEGLYCAIYRCGDNGNTELSNYWFYGLMTNGWFRQLVKSRWNELKDSFYNTLNNVVEKELVCHEAYLRNFEKWTNSFGVKHDRETELVLSIDNFYDHCFYITNWSKQRLNWLDDYYNSQDFGNGSFIVRGGLIENIE